jgi:NADPH:quinone reductase-like Zn-dependent oxidoreductase
VIRQIVIPRHGDPDVLEIRSVPAPTLAPGQVRLRVAAAGVNFADLMMRMGLYPEAPSCPFTPGYEVAGTVIEAADDVRQSRPDLAPGARVLAATHFGGYAEEACLPAAKVFPIPEAWSLAEAAAFPVVFLTAWMALVPMARVQAGDKVLIHGIAGGVGLAGLQIAKRAGANVAGTCGGSAKVQAAQEAGAERGIDYKAQDVEAAVRAWSPPGADVILEPRGGKALRESLKLLKPAGRVVAYGVSEMVSGAKRNIFRAAVAGLRMSWLSPLGLLNNNQGVFGLNVLRMWDEDELLARAMDDLLAGVQEGSLRPNLDRTFPLEDAAGAHRYLHERKNIGKVVLETGLTE